jgi:TPR repeat protein
VDTPKSIELFVKAAEAGNVKAQYNLGKSYRDGVGVEKNVAEAVKWYRRAAEQGYDKAQDSLGRRYEKGDGVELDLVQSLYWTTLAAHQGLARAKQNRERLEGTMSKQQIDAAAALVANFKPMGSAD